MKKTDFKEIGEELSENDIKKIELIIGKRFPEELKNHYMKYNGGVSKRKYFIKENGVTLEIKKFLQMKQSIDNRMTVENCFLQGQSRDYFPSELIPFAIDHGGNYFVIDANDGKIFFYAIDAWDDDLTNEQNKDKAKKCLCNSFYEFIEKLSSKKGNY